MQPAGCDEASHSKPRGITELNFENFSEAEANHVANGGECLSSNPQNPESGLAIIHSARKYRALRLFRSRQS
jgi:hypothetical protein